jgi:uncharacterized protein (TIGR02452 family)
MKNLVTVFEDTLEFSKTLPVSESIKHNFSDIIERPTGLSKDNITVINSDTVSVLVEYSKLGKTCILNMASYKKPGGGVINGARAQEESLFRCSNLFKSVSNTFYPLDKKNECVYTKTAIFFKDYNYDYMDQVECDVVTIPAINLNNYTDNDYIEVMKDKIRLMLSLASNNGVKNIILGAWGCGVFGNNPVTVSDLFRYILYREKYSSLFDNVVFAVIGDHNSVGNNYDVFKSQF